jgi:hypothetical protein
MSDKKQEQTEEARTTDFILHLLQSPVLKEEISHAIFSYGTLREIAAVQRQEQFLMELLSSLPIPITIRRQAETGYTWHCLNKLGAAPEFLGAVQNSLQYLIECLTKNAEQEP